MELNFDMIDCKDGYFILGTAADYVMRTNENNLEILGKARIKYLAGLVKLQEEIRQEFEPQLEEITDENMLSVADARELRDKLDGKYSIYNNPDFRNLYYT